MPVTRDIRLYITNHPRLYARLSKLWRRVNNGPVAKAQYIVQFRKLHRIRTRTGEEPLFSSVEIETINRCNGECSFCPVNRHSDPRPFKRMSEELFHRIIDELAGLDYSGSISLHSNNEPFIDNRIVDFMKYAKENLPKAHLFVYTNGTLLTLDRFIESMKWLDSIYIDNYSDSGEWIENVIKIRAYLDEHPELKRRVTISMRKQTEVLTSRGGTAPNVEKKKRCDLPCLLPFVQFVIRPDGKVSLCCNDPLGEVTMGDVSVSGIKEIWNSKKYRKIRGLVIRSRQNFEKCRYCDTVHTTK